MQHSGKHELDEELNWVKGQKWFYEFALPDGTKTESYLPEAVRKIHADRERILRDYLNHFSDGSSKAIDVSCHEGFFSLVLAQYFDLVVGVDKNQESLEKAKRIANLLGCQKVRFENSTVENLDENQNADFVLCFGLLYHVENPIQILRKLALLARKAICVETQILPFRVSGQVEDGSYLGQRDINGLFGLCLDYSHSKEGGLTDLALVPSRDAMVFLLRQFGFKKIDFYQPKPGDYEQFARNHRVVVFAEK